MEDTCIIMNKVHLRV